MKPRLPDDENLPHGCLESDRDFVRHNAEWLAWCEANARLIASAPDLLAALEQIAEGNTMEGQTGYTHADVIQKHYQICRNAIAKAKGETL